MMQELFENLPFIRGCPDGFCEYIDEDFVGHVANLASSRGGPMAVAADVMKALQRMCALVAV